MGRSQHMSKASFQDTLSRTTNSVERTSPQSVASDRCYCYPVRGSQSTRTLQPYDRVK